METSSSSPKDVDDQTEKVRFVTRKELETRLALFSSGGWRILMRQSVHSCGEASRVATRRSRRQGIDTMEQRAARAERLVQLGEISAGRQALESGKVAPRTLATLRALTDTDRRPLVPREPLREALLAMRPSTLSELDADRFMSNRVARRGTAPGPSRLTAEHLFPVLNNDAAVGALFQVADLLANGFIPPEAHAAIRLGRITVLEKPSGRIRGIVVAISSEGWLPELSHSKCQKTSRRQLNH